MGKVTILGAGITGLAIASQLPKNPDITMVARNFPGDEDSQEWASPWAGAIFMPMDPSTETEQKMQLESFRVRWELARRYPDSGVSHVEMEDLIDATTLDKVWYRNKLPGFRVLSKEELPPGAPLGMAYKSIILQPPVFLVWQKKRVEASSVKFLRRTVTSLTELKDMGHDVLIMLRLQEVRGRTVLVGLKFNRIRIRRGKDYTYALGRPDGTTILGGIKQYDNAVTNVDAHLRKIHENLPKDFPSDAKDFKVFGDIVGMRPQRVGGARVEKEFLGDQAVLHAYGFPEGGYIAGWGLAREVCRFVDEPQLPIPRVTMLPRAELILKDKLN
ncbi:hypothetical protein BDV12DRAFT_207823 [Aspergillus spectabilis]